MGSHPTDSFAPAPDGLSPAHTLTNDAPATGYRSQGRRWSAGAAQKSQSSSSVATALPMTYELPEPEKKS